MIIWLDQPKETYLITRGPDARTKADTSQIDLVLLHGKLWFYIILDNGGFDRLQEIAVTCNLGHGSHLLDRWTTSAKARRLRGNVPFVSVSMYRSLG